MGDLSMKEIVGTLHDVLVIVKHVSILMDFVVVNMGNDEECLSS